ncbi:hypothetical protein VNO78_08428 [Psophocarpus tetragonolobus]|uniref:H15 domain-containing protein n=1 Tax=Psophocarpus tetragonolobus TaxID=3891 RepID=A0AAN9XSV9_PSOTE
MSAAGEENATAVEKPVEEVKAPEPEKEKKPKAPKEKKPKQAKTASHPPYLQMIEEALMALNEKGGSSPYAIAKYMEEKHKAVLPANFKKILGLQLKNQAARGKLVKIKASYKLSEAGKKKKEATTKAKAEKKESRPKRSKRATAAAPKSKKSDAVKKASKKRTKKVSTPAKPKQPKSIKSPAKRARKAAA